MGGRAGGRGTDRGRGGEAMRLSQYGSGGLPSLFADALFSLSLFSPPSASISLSVREQGAMISKQSGGEEREKVLYYYAVGGPDGKRGRMLK